MYSLMVRAMVMRGCGQGCRQGQAQMIHLVSYVQLRDLAMPYMRLCIGAGARNGHARPRAGGGRAVIVVMADTATHAIQCAITDGDSCAHRRGGRWIMQTKHM